MYIYKCNLFDGKEKVLDIDTIILYECKVICGECGKELTIIPNIYSSIYNESIVYKGIRAIVLRFPVQCECGCSDNLIIYTHEEFDIVNNSHHKYNFTTIKRKTIRSIRNNTEIRFVNLLPFFLFIFFVPLFLIIGNFSTIFLGGIIYLLLSFISVNVKLNLYLSITVWLFLVDNIVPSISERSEWVANLSLIVPIIKKLELSEFLRLLLFIAATIIGLINIPPSFGVDSWSAIRDAVYPAIVTSLCLMDL